MKGVQCYELFGGIALKNHAFSFSYITSLTNNCHVISLKILDFLFNICLTLTNVEAVGFITI